MAYTITMQDLHAFHSIDRQVYVRLLDLSLDYNLAQQVVAFWYWLETKGYKYFIKMMLLLPQRWFYSLAMEAISCLNCLAVEHPQESCFDLDRQFPFMRFLVDQDFSIVELCKDRVKGLILIEGYIQNLFVRIFNDLIPINFLPNECQAQPVLVNGFPVQSCVASSFQVPVVLANTAEVPAMMANAIQPHPVAHVQAFATNGAQVLPMTANGVDARDTVANGAHVAPLVTNRAEIQTSTSNEARVPCLVDNGARVPTLLDDGSKVPPVTAGGGIEGSTTAANGIQVRNKSRNLKKDENGTHVMPNGTQNLVGVSEHDRTLFVTFSKGHSSISKEQLRELMERNFGNHVEYIHMRVDPPPLFALVVVKSAAALAEILGGEELIKLSIRGKDVWLRRFLSKRDDKRPLPLQ